MLDVTNTTRFKKDLKRYALQEKIIKELDVVLKKLRIPPSKLDQKYKDHALIGNWHTSRECHLFPDVLLIYQINHEENLLILERIGPHSDLF